MLHGLIWLRSGDRRRATRAATGAGQIVGSLLAALGLLMALNGRWDGLWLVVVGWFLTGSAVGERAYAAVVEELEGLTAADAMTSAPRVAPEWWTVQAFVDGVEAARRAEPGAAAAPVVPGGGPAGPAHGRAPAGGPRPRPPAERRNVPIRRIARPCGPEQVVGADEPLVRVTGRLPVGTPFLLVVEEGRLVGVLTAGDLAATAALHALRADPSSTSEAAAGDVAEPNASR